MGRTRLKVYTEREMHAIIDPEKLALNYGDMSGRKLENHLWRIVMDGDASPTDILNAVGVEGEIELYVDADVDFAIEEECERHTGSWFRITPPREKCSECSVEKLLSKSERRKQ